jgi:hypothetical protein
VPTIGGVSGRGPLGSGAGGCSLPPSTGTISLLGADAAPVPAALVAVTVNTYPTPFEGPAIRIGLDAPLAVASPGDAVTVYRRIGSLPIDEGGAKPTVASPSPGGAQTRGIVV